MKEIEVPKHLRQFMLEGAQETKLGDKKGAKKQYRYGNLHIREYDDKYTVHVDKYDPRSDPIRHLVWDAPEVLIGLAGAIIGGSKVGSYLYNKNKSTKQSSIFSGLIASLVTGYASYVVSKKLKEEDLGICKNNSCVHQTDSSNTSSKKGSHSLDLTGRKKH